jgi:hypothetical protein
VKESGNRRLSKCLRTVAAAIVASGTAATSRAYAWPSGKPIVVQVGNQAEIVRFLDGKGDAVLDLNEASAPALIEDGITATSRIDPNTQGAS